jgi:hypothetical protein
MKTRTVVVSVAAALCVLGLLAVLSRDLGTFGPQATATLVLCSDGTRRPPPCPTSTPLSGNPPLSAAAISGTATAASVRSIAQSKPASPAAAVSPAAMRCMTRDGTPVPCVADPDGEQPDGASPPTGLAGQVNNAEPDSFIDNSEPITRFRAVTDERCDRRAGGTAFGRCVAALAREFGEESPEDLEAEGNAGRGGPPAGLPGGP